MKAERNTGASRLRRTVLGAVGASLLSIALAAAPVRAAKSWDVQATDDGNATGTCPTVNTFGYPTGGNCFIPDNLTIAVGDTVVWKGTGKRPHDIIADDGSFKSPGAVDPGKSWSFTFTKAGDFPYYCSLHGDKGGIGHAAKIVVTASGAPQQQQPPQQQQYPPPGGTAQPGATPAQGSGGTVVAGGTAGPIGGFAIPQSGPVVLAAPPQIPTTMKVTVAEDPREAPASTAGPGNGFLGGLLAGLLVSTVATLTTRFAPKTRRRGV